MLSKLKLNRTIELAIGLVLFVVIVYLASITIKVTSGVSKTMDSSQHQVRLQVLNGCGVRGAASKVADRLGRYFDDEIEIMIVDTDNFDLTEIPSTFLISRIENKKASELLAEKLGLDASNIEYRPMENNYRQVSVTLVLGADFEQVGFATDDQGQKRRFK